MRGQNLLDETQLIELQEWILSLLNITDDQDEPLELNLKIMEVFTKDTFAHYQINVDGSDECGNKVECETRVYLTQFENNPANISGWWNISPIPPTKTGATFLRTGYVIGGSVGGLFILLLLLFFGVRRIVQQHRAKSQAWKTRITVGELDLEISDEVLGTGSQAIVYRAIDLKTGSMLAVKQFRGHNKAQRELRMLQELSNPHVIELFGSVAGPDNSLLLVMELLPGGTLADLVPRTGLGLQLVSKYTEEILTGVNALHAHDIIHRDIKPNNVLMDSAGHCKIADMGFATHEDTMQKLSIAENSSNADSSGFIGTLIYSPPELLSGIFSKPGDVWMIGMVAVSMFLGHHPWVHMEDAAAMLGALDDITDLHPVVEEISNETFWSFLSHCLCKDPRRRWTCQQLKQHPFITDKKGRPLQPVDTDERTERGALTRVMNEVMDDLFDDDEEDGDGVV
eukprot:TRINITY_DN65843_c1_g2_i13.p1 TRINITY_DN65843_c1_g2~~TRINITY_DN65843_c1_g2_i13.p1  ORF type:complete len:455 (+),score=54.40 TRINITY_DN65843_c1_g2_i13:3-1367(+)